MEACKVLIGVCDGKYPTDDEGNTPLHLAAKAGETEVCKVLLENFDEKHPKNNDKETPLSLAKDFRRSDVVEVLQSRRKRRKK